jgi:hypothetical protein
MGVADEYFSDISAASRQQFTAKSSGASAILERAI